MVPMVVYHARKTAARRMARHTGMNYTAALRYMDETRDRQPRHRWILTDPVRRFLGGEDWIGLRYKNLYDWLDRLDPSYRCQRCYKPGDARRQDSSITLRIVRYDPDLSPRTWLRAVTKYHAVCVPSDVVWDDGSDVPEQPEELKLTEGPFEAVFTLCAMSATTLHGDQRQPPLLVITAELVEGDSVDSFSRWDRELGRMLQRHGFRPCAGPGGGGPPIPVWSIRAEPGNPVKEEPPWIALRSTPVKAGTITKHFYFGPILSMTNQWLKQATAAGQVEVLVTTRLNEEELSCYSAQVALDARRWSRGRSDSVDEQDADVLEDIVNAL